jgi:LL-diaminopimelate aminotransferase
MKIQISDRLQTLQTGIFLELANCKQEARKKGISVIDLSVGSPDLPPSTIVVETLAQAVQDTTKYGYTLKGIPEFHKAVADFYQSRYGVTLSPEREVLQLMGSQDGLAHLASAIINPGDYVLVPDPGYPIYEASVKLAGGTIYPLPLLEEYGFLPQLQNVPEEILAKTKMMIISYPGNPVPALADRAFFEQVVAFAKRHSILVVHDFAYSELIFDHNPKISFLSVPGAKEVGIEFNSLSKTFNMAGCRIGYVVGNETALGILASLKSHMDYGIFYPIQKAAVAALRADHAILDQQARVYERRRDALLQGLANGGWQVPSSPATMFVWAKLPAGWSSRTFALRLLEEAGVAVVPGYAFGSQGEGYVRIALVQSEELLAQAADRIGAFLKSASPFDSIAQ